VTVTGELQFPHTVAPEAGEAVEVAEGVFWLRLPLPMALDHVNVYLLDDGAGWTAIDTGISSRKSRAIWEDVLARPPFAGKALTRVIVTHHHPDHVGNAGWMQKDLEAELWTTRTAWLFARMLSLDEQHVWPQETLDYYWGAGMDREIFEARKQERPFNYADIVYPMPLGFRRIGQGDTLVIGGRRWEVQIGHGHAPEHATFWSADDNLVISGDQVIPGISPNLGVYATEPEADPVRDWIESCRRLAEIAEDRHFVLPGHKLPFTGLPLRLEQQIQNHTHALDRLSEHLVAPRTAAECFVPLFRREIGAAEHVLALVEAVAHLNHLSQAGKVNRWRREDGVWLWQRK